MKGKAYLIAGVLFLLTLGYNFYVWGGLGRSPILGPLVTQGAQREVSLAGLYVPVGRSLVESAGLHDTAVQFAQARFESLQPRMLANPAAAMDTLMSNLPSSVRVSYYGAPILLLVFAYLFWRRPRVVHAMGSR
jgi:hypothetical protein